MTASPTIKRPPSLRDLAKELKVSHTTVAMALKNDTRISYDVRKRVQAVAHKQGYFANEIPKNLFSGRSSFIGLSVPDFRDSFYARMFEGVQEALWDAGKMPLVVSSGEDSRREESILERHARLRAEGVILVPVKAPPNRAHFAEVLKKSTVLVTVERTIPGHKLPHVCADEATGISHATLHMLEAERRRLVFCSSNLDDEETARIRQQGYSKVMERTGLLGISTRLNLLRGSRADILAEVEALLNLPPEGNVDGVVAASDETARALVPLLNDLGLQVPGDISLTGYGNRLPPWNKPFYGPPLTTVDPMPEKIGREAALLLLNLLDRPGFTPHTILVEPELVEGGTTAIAAKKDADS